MIPALVGFVIRFSRCNRATKSSWNVQSQSAMLCIAMRLYSATERSKIVSENRAIEDRLAKPSDEVVSDRAVAVSNAEHCGAMHA